MRPLLLKMSAFGPFATTQDIDFRLLGDSPLFLINGPTGSGKTTILDAIAYALYGETTGNERLGREMRCDHAASDQLTKVMLEFELGQRRYRIRRIPRQERPRARGEGFTIQQPEAELWVLDEQGQEQQLLVAKKVKDATVEIVRLTGLSAEQFRQVMVLPQGRFRELLLADSSQREDIFRQLFQTRIYSRLEQQLKEQAADIAYRVAELQAQEKGLLSGVEADSREALCEQIEALSEALKALQQQQQEAEEALRLSRQQVFDARNLRQQFEALDVARKQLETRQKQQPQLEADRQRWQLAEKAHALQPLYERMQQAQQQWTEAERAYQDARQTLGEAQQALQIATQNQQQAAATEPQLDQLKQQQQQLRGYVERARQLKSALQDKDEAEAGLAQSTQLEAQKAEETRVLRRQLDELEEQLESDATVLHQLPQRQRELDELSARLQKLEAWNRLQQEVNTAQAALRKAEKAETIATERLRLAQQQQRQLDQAWEQGQAAVLAGQLQVDLPCPVCGSTEHPHPAQAGEKLPGEAQREQAKEATETARKALSKLQSGKSAISAKLEALASQQQQLRDELGEAVDETQETSRSRMSSVFAIVTELQQIHQGTEKRARQRDQLRKKLQEAEAAWQQLQQQVNEATNQTAAAEQDVQNKRAELPPEYADPQVLEKSLDEVSRKQRSLEQQIRDARSEFEQARVTGGAARATCETITRTLQQRLSEKDKQATSWQAALADSALASEQVFLQVVMDDADRDALAADIRHRDDELLAAQTLLKEKEAELKEKTAPDLQALEQQHGQLEAAARQVTESSHRSAQQLQALEDVGKRLKQFATQRDSLHQEYALVGRLAEVANGNNEQKLSLHRFVLGVLLDDVLISARQRLLQMSKGRYQLLRREDVGDKRRASGLDLVVEDAFSGKSRPVATLSGGESFMAALALALGLSEVVQAYAGGIRLDALFIDEGFGSLDPESLDLAINTLLDLQSGGRMVGIISHVPELKERIDVRLDIEADRSGSRVMVVVS